MSLTISGIATSDTPEQGRIKINANDSIIEATLSSHMVDPAAHLNAGDGNIVNTAGLQTLTNKVITSASNTLTLLTEDIVGPLLSIKSLAYDDTVFSDTTQDFGDQNDGSGLDIITISGTNGIEVRKLNQSNYLHHGLMISHPKDVVLDHTSGQTLAVNIGSVEPGEQFKVSGKSTFTQDVTIVGGTGLDITAGGLRLATDVFVQSDATDASTSSWSTGSIQTAGGLGIAKKLYVGDDIYQATNKAFKSGSGALALDDSSGNTILSNAASPVFIDSEDVSFRDYSDPAKYVSVSNGTISTTGHILPITTDSVDLGSNSRKWQDLYLSGDALLDVNSKLKIGGLEDGLLIKQTSATATIEFHGGSGNTGALNFENNSGETILSLSQTAAALNYSGLTKLNTTNTGITITGDAIASTFTGALIGNADTATKWAATKTISLTGDATGTSTGFDGSNNMSIAVTVGDYLHQHSVNNIDNLQNLLDAKMPLIGGTFTGDVTLSNPSYTEPKATGTFSNSTQTKQNKIYFSKALANEGQNGGSVANSNDPGYIIHETSNAYGDHDKGVIHICPTDNNSGADYVSIHGTNDPETIKLFTSGQIITPNTVTADRLIATSPGTTALESAGGLKVNNNIDLNKHELINTKAVQFKDWDDSSGGTNNAYRILARDGAIQVHNGTFRVGAFSNNTTFGTGTSEIASSGNIKTQALMYQKTDAPVGCTVAVGLDNSTRPFSSLALNGQWSLTGIRLPQTGLYKLTANIQANFAGIGLHDCKVRITLGGTVMGHWYTTTYDDSNSYAEYQIRAACAICFRGAASDIELKFEIVTAPSALTGLKIRNYHLEYIGPTSNSDWKLT